MNAVSVNGSENKTYLTGDLRGNEDSIISWSVGVILARETDLVLFSDLQLNKKLRDCKSTLSRQYGIENRTVSLLSSDFDHRKGRERSDRWDRLKSSSFLTTYANLYYYDL